MDLKKIIKTAFENAREKTKDIKVENDVKDDVKGNNHSIKASFWVESLALELHKYTGNDLKCFYKENKLKEEKDKINSVQNKKDFLIIEYLHDILICSTEVVKSSKKKKDLDFINHVFWQVESELIHSRDGRQILLDFNKLILGSAKNKLFIASQKVGGDEADFLNFLSEPADVCSGNLYLALIPHPEQWDDEYKIKVYEFINGWREIE